MSEKTLQPGDKIKSGDADDFDEMMDALDAFFHVTTCPNHSDAERKEAFGLAYQAYYKFAGDPDDTTGDASPPGIGNHNRQHVLGDDDKQNAPTSMKVH
jgi:hypothetical protein